MLVVAMLSMLFAGRLGRAWLRTSIESELMRSAIERRLSAIVDASPAIIYSCDYGGQWDVTFISGKVTQTFGYEPDECMAGSWWAGTLHPQDRARVFEGLAGLEERGHHTHEYRMATKNGD